MQIYTLSNREGSEARIADYGGTILSLKVPDRDGTMGDVVLGFDSPDDYPSKSPYFGCLVGRFGNRIAGGRFDLDGKTFTLPINDAPNTLHGGARGFDKVVWDARQVETDEGPALELHYLSPDGEEGFPGNLDVTAVYTLTHDHALRLDFTATTDRPTVVNLTNHAYFNLAGPHGADILDHEVQIFANHYLPVDEGLIPTGELAPVRDTPFDFREPHAIGARIDADHEQLRRGGGYDHNWVLTGRTNGTLHPASHVYCDKTGRTLETWTTEPGVQFYSGNFLDGTLVGKGGVTYPRRSAFCFEPQKFPDAPNQPSFPSTVLRPGEVYRHSLAYRFGVR